MSSDYNSNDGGDDLVLQAAFDLLDAMHKQGDKWMGKVISDIVKGHSVGATAAALAGGWIPGFGGAVATTMSAGFIWSMYYRINDKLEIPFTKNLVKSIGTAVCTNLASYFVGGLVLTTVFSLLPGLGTLGALAIIGTTIYGLTWASGLIYLKVLAAIARSNPTFRNVSEADLKRTADNVIRNENIDTLKRKAKQQYETAERNGDINKNSTFDKEEF